MMVAQLEDQGGAPRLEVPRELEKSLPRSRGTCATKAMVETFGPTDTRRKCAAIALGQGSQSGMVGSQKIRCVQGDLGKKKT